MNFSDRIISNLLGVGGPVAFERCDDPIGQISANRYDSGDEASFANIYPSLQKSKVIECGSIPFPEICVACGAPSSVSLPLQPVGVRDLCASYLPFSSRILVPHCAAHANTERAKLILQILDKGTNHLSVTCIARSYLFMLNFRNLLAVGEMPPPWIAFKYSIPIFGWNQGTQEDWMMFGWEPFWDKLPALERSRYLSTWNAPDEWSEYLQRHGAKSQTINYTTLI